MKVLYYARLFFENASNSKMVWTIINGLLNRKVSPVLKEIINNGVVLKNEALANYTKEYFTSTAAAISAAVPRTSVFTCLAPTVSASCFFLSSYLRSHQDYKELRK